MTIKNDDNSQFAYVSDPSLPVFSNGHGAYPICDKNGRLIINQPLNGVVFTTSLSMSHTTNPQVYDQINANPILLFQAWGSTDPLVGNTWVQFFDTGFGIPAGTPSMSAIPCNSGGLWSVSFPEGLAFSAGCVIGYSTTHNTWVADPTGGHITALYRQT